MPKLNELQQAPTLTGALLFAAGDPDTGELYKGTVADLIALFSGSGGRFGIEDNTSAGDRAVEMGPHSFYVETDTAGVYLQNNLAQIGVNGKSYLTTTDQLASITSNNSSSQRQIIVTGDYVQFNANIGGVTQSPVIVPTPTDFDNHYLAVSVNNVFAGPDGNIILEGGGGGGGAASRFGIEDNTSAVDRDFDAQNHYLDISSLSYFSTTSRNESKFSGLYHTPDILSMTLGDNSSGNTGLNVQSYLKIDNTGGIYERVNSVNSTHTIQRFVEKNGDYNIPLTVNNQAADSTGNITLETGGGGGGGAPSLQAVTDISFITTSPIWAAHFDVIANGVPVANLNPDNNGGGNIGGLLSLKSSNTNNTIVVRPPNIMGESRAVRFPDASGTIAVLGDMSSQFTDNAAAIAGGLPVGGIYRSGDFLKIVH